ncbi:LacI family DNA-binding transcriptional regulator [Gynuella sunshinyii]|uniref:Transcriptional regulator n=1 Tax=Gynuella sunshinyii YC6258 TaxID=1445510 RepID=A0A0C5VU37_9GAMM|nr:LacI family DNA-binding transcriptional regulator [Gynuella sunshinyii]AJQ96808.1 transcriptional regulator [Gynuella sunshinyii YC6258]
MSIKTLAAKLGVSVSTVSRALNDYPDISSHTKSRVRKAAAELGYQISSRDRYHTLQKAYCVGLILLQQDDYLVDPSISALLGSVTRCLQQHHYLAHVITLPRGEQELIAFEQTIKLGQFDGLIIIRTRTNDPRVNRLLKLNIPFVCYGRTEKSSQFAWVDMDNVQVFTAAIERLLSLGHRNIGFINISEQFHFARDRLTGLQNTLQQYDFKLPEWRYRCCDFSAAQARQLTIDMLAHDHSITALVCATDHIARGVYSACRSLGLKIGLDLSVIGCDDAVDVAYMDPPLTTVGTDEDTGRVLAETLLKRIDGEPISGLQRLLPPKLVVRESDQPFTHLSHPQERIKS